MRLKYSALSNLPPGFRWSDFERLFFSEPDEPEEEPREEACAETGDDHGGN